MNLGSFVQFTIQNLSFLISFTTTSRTDKKTTFKYHLQDEILFANILGMSETASSGIPTVEETYAAKKKILKISLYHSPLN